MLLRSLREQKAEVRLKRQCDKRLRVERFSQQDGSSHGDGLQLVDVARIVKHVAAHEKLQRRRLKRQREREAEAAAEEDRYAQRAAAQPLAAALRKLDQSKRRRLRLDITHTGFFAHLSVAELRIKTSSTILTR